MFFPIQALLFTALFINANTQSLITDYYWRDWNGTAPNDGVIAGQVNDLDAYVAQAYVKNYGLYIGYVSDGDTTININTGSVNEAPLNTSSVIKVLCVRTGHVFPWIKANTDNINSILEYYLPVIGGIANVEYNEIVYIGRYVSNQNTYVGSIHSDMWLYYSNGTVGLDSKEYELLVKNN